MLFFGMFLTATGVAVLLYLGYLAVQVIHNPNAIQIVALLLEQLKNNEAVISGFLGAEKIDLHLSEALRLMLLMLLGVVVMSILASVAKTVFMSGLNMMKFAANPHDDTQHDAD